ncbi:hypothetical protein M1583_01250 [Candidatus Marsarchaeota archaeon]|nr:hypothetical protein [Candidatus Marsarchaeota archaeon]
MKRIKPDTTVEKFGALINSSFFDASNALGTLKIKGLVDFTTYVPGQNAITVTEMGKKLIEEADTKEKMPFDQLDFAILTQLSTGKRNLADLSTAVNISPKDLGMHLYKLSEQQYISADIRNGSLDMSLTEKGFMQAKAGMPQQVSQPAQTAQAPRPQPQQNPQSGAQNQQPQHLQSVPQAVPPQQAKPMQPQPLQPQQAQQQAPALTQGAQQPAQASQPMSSQPQQQTHPPEDKELAEMQKQLSSTSTKKTGSKSVYLIGIIVVIIIILIALFAKGVL